MKLYMLSEEQFLPISKQEAWDFFSSPKNLPKITPDYLSFKITSKIGLDKMYPGQIITYIVKPLLGIPLRWATEITQVKDNEFFIDEQRFGPYAFWHHQHWFEEKDGGVLMKDIVHYGLPLGPLGRLANALFVNKQLQGIFSYRKQVVDELLKKGELGKTSAYSTEAVSI